jgi:hypothetical protein
MKIISIFVKMNKISLIDIVKDEYYQAKEVRQDLTIPRTLMLYNSNISQYYNRLNQIRDYLWFDDYHINKGYKK